jgi:predicted amidohydrolase
MSANDRRLMQLSAVSPDTDVLIGLYEDGLGVHNYNAASYYESDQLVHTHRKLYLPTYDIFEERKHFSPGQSMRAFDTRHGRTATLICNDAWQPHLVFLAIQDGARVLLVPTNSAQSRFPEQYDSRTYWRDITVFYARMFQCYVVFVNRVGEEGEHLRFWGGSHIVDPWGKIVTALPDGEEAVRTFEIDLSTVRKRRREVPLVREARLGCSRARSAGSPRRAAMSEAYSPHVRARSEAERSQPTATGPRRGPADAVTIDTLGPPPGAVAEWLRSGLQSRLLRFESGRRLQRGCRSDPCITYGTGTARRRGTPAAARGA